jgi:membrane associated rhomboid family serine protease
LVFAFFLQYGVLHRPFCNEYLALSLEGLKRGFVWQFLTFQFLHAGLLHLVLNGWMLYMFGREVEVALGKARFLTLYFASGIVGGLFQILIGWIWPNIFGGGVVGASAGIFGVVAAFAMLDPDRTLLLFFFLPMRARTLLIFSVVVALLGLALAAKTGDNVAHAAHLGGILVGFAWVKLGWHRDFIQLPWEGWFSGRKLFRQRYRKSELIKATTIRIPGVSRAKSEPPTDLPEEEFISREVDPILDKISQHGIQSLTERERKILQAARNKMAKR